MNVPLNTGIMEGPYHKPHFKKTLANPVPSVGSLPVVKPSYYNNVGSKVSRNKMIAGTLHDPPKHRPLDSGINTYTGKLQEITPQEYHKPSLPQRDAALHSLHYFDIPVQYLEPDARMMMYRDKNNESFNDYVQDLADERMREKVVDLQRKGYNLEEIKKSLTKLRENDIDKALKDPTNVNALMNAQLAQNTNINQALTGRNYGNEVASTPMRQPDFVPTTVPQSPQTPSRTASAKSAAQMNKTELLTLLRSYGTASLPANYGKLTVLQLRTLLRNLREDK